MPDSKISKNPLDIAIFLVVIPLGSGSLFAAHWYTDTYLPGAERARRAESAQELIRAKLSDPASAQFRSVVVYRDAVCGEVNAKNRFGGYIGFTAFYVPPEASLVWVDSGSSKLAAELCASRASRFKSSGQSAPPTSIQVSLAARHNPAS